MAADVPSLEDAAEVLAAAEIERDFWQKQYGTLLRQYPDQFVAAHQGKVIATSPDLDGLLEDLKREGIDPTQVWLRFLDTNPRRLRL